MLKRLLLVFIFINFLHFVGASESKLYWDLGAGISMYTFSNTEGFPYVGDLEPAQVFTAYYSLLDFKIEINRDSKFSYVFGMVYPYDKDGSSYSTIDYITSMGIFEGGIKYYLDQINKGIYLSSGVSLRYLYLDTIISDPEKGDSIYDTDFFSDFYVGGGIKLPFTKFIGLNLESKYYVNSTDISIGTYLIIGKLK